MEEIKKIISGFESVSLEEMESVKLMDRIDSKYIFRIEQLPAILEEMKNTYRLLEIDNTRLHRYESLYYDTKDFKFYNQHSRGKLNRHKIRFRRYADSGGLTFFEIKYKRNTGRTVKKRVKKKEVAESIFGKAENLLREITLFSPEMFSPTIWVNYSRMTFINKFSPERLTVDVNLNFIPVAKNGNGEKSPINFPQLVIAESKRDKASSVSKFIRLVRENLVREGAISKYCLGVYHLFPDSVKSNNLKERIRYVHKVLQQNIQMAN